MIWKSSIVCSFELNLLLQDVLYQMFIVCTSNECSVGYYSRCMIEVWRKIIYLWIVCEMSKRKKIVILFKDRNVVLSDYIDCQGILQNVWK